MYIIVYLYICIFIYTYTHIYIWAIDPQMIRHGLAICDETIRDPCGFVDLSFPHRVLMFHKWCCSIHW